MSEPQLHAPMRSPLGRAIGLGSAKEGVDHWWVQRLTAIALVPLALWFVVAVIEHAGADRADVVEWLHHPVPAVMMVLLLIAAFYHSALGLQVVIEDYVASESARLVLLVANKLLWVILAVLGIFAVLKISLAG